MDERKAKAIADMKQRNLQNKQREEAIKTLKWDIPFYKEQLALKQKSLELSKKIQPIVMENMFKLTPEYKYEEIDEYNTLLKEIQKTSNEMRNSEEKHNIEAIKLKIAQMEEQLEMLTEQEKMVNGND